jgi:uncharacterized membrane protein
MDPGLFAKAHGATTHFPVALALGSLLFESVAFGVGNRPIARTLRAAGYWSIALGAVGSLGAVASGLLMTQGGVLGHGALRLHHQFVWPAFGLLVTLATWRVLTGERATRRASAVYLAALGLMAVLMLAAAYWGGEMMIRQ